MVSSRTPTTRPTIRHFILTFILGFLYFVGSWVVWLCLPVRRRLSPQAPRGQDLELPLQEPQVLVLRLQLQEASPPENQQDVDAGEPEDEGAWRDIWNAHRDHAADQRSPTDIPLPPSPSSDSDVTSRANVPLPRSPFSDSGSDSSWSEGSLNPMDMIAFRPTLEVLRERREASAKAADRNAEQVSPEDERWVNIPPCGERSGDEGNSHGDLRPSYSPPSTISNSSFVTGVDADEPPADPTKVPLPSTPSSSSGNSFATVPSMDELLFDLTQVALPVTPTARLRDVGYYTEAEDLDNLEADVLVDREGTARSDVQELASLRTLVRNWTSRPLGSGP